MDFLVKCNTLTIQILHFSDIDTTFDHLGIIFKP